jgi:hypothetical protein
MERELKYMILSASEVNAIDFMEVMDQSAESLIRSKDGSKVYVKWERDDVPPSITALTTKEGPYTPGDMYTILQGSDWK